MADDLKQQILDYLKDHNTMTLATCSGEVPWAATVFFASDGLSLYFFSAPESRHCQNLAANARVAVTVQEDYQDWRKIKGIQLEGRVELVDGVGAKAKAMTVYALKYPEVIKLFTDPTKRGVSQGVPESEVLLRGAGETVLYRQRARVWQAPGVAPLIDRRTGT